VHCTCRGYDVSGVLFDDERLRSTSKAVAQDLEGVRLALVELGPWCAVCCLQLLLAPKERNIFLGCGTDALDAQMGISQPALEAPDWYGFLGLPVPMPSEGSGECKRGAAEKSVLHLGRSRASFLLRQ
jgi:hypothetical protein